MALPDLMMIWAWRSFDVVRDEIAMHMRAEECRAERAGSLEIVRSSGLMLQRIDPIDDTGESPKMLVKGDQSSKQRTRCLRFPV